MDREKNLSAFMRESHAVDESGNPLRLYHGTADDFSEFRHGHPNKKDAGWLGRGFYFTNSPAMANSYAMLKPGKAENLMPVHLSLKNPFYATMDHKTALKNALMDDPYAAEEFRNRLMEAGHDGVILDYGTKDNVREYVAFDPTQIKSATGNQGTFDPSNPDITKADGGALTDDEGITAYHGSPHDFEQFDVSKIGTGEGAQAFGHGLYFAGNEDVAKGYRDRLSGHHPGDVKIGDEEHPHWARREVANAFTKLGYDPETSVIAAHYINEHEGDLDKASGAIWNNENIPDSVAEALLKAEYAKSAGHMYEVHINAHPDHFLDWDAPLSKQGEHIQDLARSIPLPEKNLRTKVVLQKWREGQDKEFGREATGETLHHILSDYGANQTDATNALQSIGVRGIRYLDRGSRSEGEGTRNYVVFNHDHVKVRRKYERGGAV